MFDSKEISRRALLRAEEIKERKKHTRARLNTLALMMCTCIVSLAVGLMFITYSDNYLLTRNLTIEDTPTPLASFPMTAISGENNPNYLIPGFSSITIPAGVTGVKMTLPNPEGNSCWFSFEVVLADTGEVLYISELLPPAERIERITLTRELDQGEYKGLLTVRMYAMDIHNEFGAVKLPFDLIVK